MTSSDSNEVKDSPIAIFCIEIIKTTQEYIKEIQAATFENGNLNDNVIHWLCNPPEEPTSISNLNICLSLDLFLAITNASEETYHASCDAILHHYPNSGILSYHAVKKLVADITGVIAVYNDMCINSCHAFTGPFALFETCSICREAWYNLASTGKKVPHQQFCTILLSPQLQALRCSHSGAKDMCYLNRKLNKVTEMLSNLETDTANIIYDDILYGSEMQELAKHIRITGDNTVVSSFLDGAQLYQNKKSDTWISIWVLNKFSPNQCY